MSYNRGLDRDHDGSPARSFRTRFVAKLNLRYAQARTVPSRARSPDVDVDDALERRARRWSFRSTMSVASRTRRSAVRNGPGIDDESRPPV